MQSKQSSRIEQSFAVRSIDRSYPERVCLLPLLCLHPRILTQLLTYVTLPSPSGSHSLNTRFKLNNLGRHRCLACLPPYPVSNRMSRYRQSLPVHPCSPRVQSLSHAVCGFPIFPFTSLFTHPRFQFYCSVKAPPISLHAQNC